MTMAGSSPALSDNSATASGTANAAMPSVASTASVPSVPSMTSIASAPPESGDGAPEQGELVGSEAVEKELRDLLGKMEESYKEFSETVFKTMDSMREKIALLEESVVDLNDGVDKMDSLDSPTSSGKSRSAMQRKRRA